MQTFNGGLKYPEMHIVQRNIEPEPIRYKFYATLLDAYQWYLTSEQDEAFQDLINKINRVPFKSEAADKGKAFNELVDDETILEVTDKVKYKGFKFDRELINYLKAYFTGAVRQVYTSAELPTSRGLVSLYGLGDYVFQDTAFDLKTVGYYEFPKFFHGWQHKIYTYCFNQNNIQVSKFEYTVTDFNTVFKEQYVYKPEQHIQELKSICVGFIDFLERHRSLITDKKVFGLI